MCNYMITIESLTLRVHKTQHGFTDILKAAQEVRSSHSSAEILSLAKDLFASDIHQARCADASANPKDLGTKAGMLY